MLSSRRPAQNELNVYRFFFLSHVALFGLFFSLTGLLLIFYDFWFCDFYGFWCVYASRVFSLFFFFLNSCLFSKERGLGDWGCGEDLDVMEKGKP